MIWLSSFLGITGADAVQETLARLERASRTPALSSWKRVIQVRSQRHRCLMYHRQEVEAIYAIFVDAKESLGTGNYEIVRNAALKCWRGLYPMVSPDRNG